MKRKVRSVSFARERTCQDINRTSAERELCWPIIYSWLLCISHCTVANTEPLKKTWPVLGHVTHPKKDGYLAGSLHLTCLYLCCRSDTKVQSRVRLWLEKLGGCTQLKLSKDHLSHCAATWGRFPGSAEAMVSFCQSFFAVAAKQQ